MPASEEYRASTGKVLRIRPMRPDDAALWDRYVLLHPASNLYQLSGWKAVIERAYGHRTHYLLAEESDNFPDSPSPLGASGKEFDRASAKAAIRMGEAPSSGPPNPSGSVIVGILPLVHIKHVFFGNSLISIPFFDFAGILANNVQIEKDLLREAAALAKASGARAVELRHIQPLEALSSLEQEAGDDALNGSRCVTRSHKVRMTLDLPETSDELMKSFRSKLRSQIMKPIKGGLHAKIGGLELLDDFYRVFSINMRDLGSPVHSRSLLYHVLTVFPEKSRIIMAYKDSQPLAGSVVIAFRDVMENPWASSLRAHSKLSPNMLLYWTMLRHACDNGCRQFDFGRSTPGEGTFKFKEQWGAAPTPLHWHFFPLAGQSMDDGAGDEGGKRKIMVECWCRLPVWLTRIIGPHVRKYIGL